MGCGVGVRGGPKAALARSRTGDVTVPWPKYRSKQGCSGICGQAGTVPTPVMSCQAPPHTALPTSSFPDTAFPLLAPILIQWRCSHVPVGTVPVPSEPPHQCSRLRAIGSLLAHSGCRGILIRIFHNCAQTRGAPWQPPSPWQGSQRGSQPALGFSCAAGSCWPFCAASSSGNEHCETSLPAHVRCVCSPNEAD